MVQAPLPGHLALLPLVPAAVLMALLVQASAAQRAPAASRRSRLAG